MAGTVKSGPLVRAVKFGQVMNAARRRLRGAGAGGGRSSRGIGAMALGVTWIYTGRR